MSLNKTQIDWVKNPDGTQGYTWNPISGCLNNCSYCYARKLANTRQKERYLTNEDIAVKPTGDNRLDECWAIRESNPFYPRFWEDKLKEPLYPSKSLGIFTCSMSDLFGIGIPEDWTLKVLDIISRCPAHRFYLLTKQPQNLRKFSPFPDNCLVGASASNSHKFSEATFWLSGIEARVKYLSLEPLQERILPHYIGGFGDVRWVIIGALTGTKADLLPLHHKTGLIMVRLNGNRWSLQPQIEWVKEIIEACDKAGIPVFLKENLMPLFVYPMPGLFTKKTPASRLELRQEMPV